MVTGTPWVASCTVTVDQELVEVCSGPEAADSLTYGAFGEGGTREFFTHVRFHKHDEDKITIHLLVELYARSAEEARGARGGLARRADDHLAGRGEPPPGGRVERERTSRRSRRYYSSRCSSSSSCLRSSGGRLVAEPREVLVDRAAAPCAALGLDAQQLAPCPRSRRPGPRCRSRPSAGTSPTGVSIASASPSQRRKIHASTRLFSPKPGHRNLPSSSLRNQLTLKIFGSFAASPSRADLAASGRSSRPCGSRRTAASRTGRSAACRRRPRRRPSSPTTSSRPMNTPCSQSNASRTSGTTVERRPPNRIASIGTPAGSSHSAAIDGHLRGRRGEARVGMGGRVSESGVQSLPCQSIACGGRLLGHALPPHVAVVGAARSW